MTVTETLMKTGSWSLKLRPDTTPWWLRRRMTAFSNIIVTGAHAGAITDFDGLKEQALYSGLLTRWARRRGEFSGVGLLGYLGTGKASAGIWHANYQVLSFPATYEDLIDHWFDEPVPYANGITKGSNLSATATTYDSLSEGVLPDMKQTLDTLAEMTGNEYRVTHQGLIDFGADVFDTRNILVSPDVRQGVAADWLLWEPVSWNPEADVDDYRNTGVVLISDKTLSAVSGGSVWSTPGVVPQMRTWDNSYTHTCVYANPEKTIESMSTSDALKAANALSVNRAKPRYSVSCNVNVSGVTGHLVPGDSVWIYDALEGIQGDAHTGVPGLDISAVEQRVYSITWPIEEGMGVYLVDGSFLSTPDVPEVFDITPYVDFEDGPASLELGMPVSLSADKNLVD